MTGNIDNSRKKKIHILITLAVMVFIFVQSALPGYLSGAESGMVVSFIRWFANVTGLSGLAELDADTIHIVVRKLAHFFEYMLLGGCLMVNAHDWYEERGTHIAYAGGLQSTWRLVFIAWIIGVMYATTDEIHQLFVSDRAGSPRDVCIDSAGAAIGAVLMHILWLRRNRSDKHNRESAG